MFFLEMMSRPKAWMVLGFAAFTLLLWRLSRIRQRPKGFPPGPPTLPLIGNLHQMPKSLGHLQFEKWAREYGPVFSLMLGTKVVIVLSSDFAVKDLLDKRSAIYSSRPEVYLGQEIVSGGLRPLFMVCSLYVVASLKSWASLTETGVWRCLAQSPEACPWCSERESGSELRSIPRP